MKLKYFGFLSACLSLILFFSCDNNADRLDIDVSDIEIDEVDINRYGKTLFELDKTSFQAELLKIQPEYKVFLSGDLNDTFNVQQLYNFVSDPFLIKLYEDCNSVYPDLNFLEKDLSKAFEYYKYYFPKEHQPEVFTFISGLDHEYRVQYYGPELVIALDNYLGADYPEYQNLNLPSFKLRIFDKPYIFRDCINELGKSKVDSRRVGKTFLDQMINEGKQLYFLDAMAVDMPDSIKIYYSDYQMDWAVKNEAQIWAFFIENELLYEKDMAKLHKLLLDGPFTSFFGNDSPPRLGWWIGWQIVKNFMNKNGEISLPQLMNEYDARKILNQSGYKPKI
jgi:hypothetical protein